MTRWIDGSRRHGIVAVALWAIGSLLVGAIIAMWSWNTIGHELLGAPRSEFRHGLAAMAMLLVIAWTFRFGRRHAAHEER